MTIRIRIIALVLAGVMLLAVGGMYVTPSTAVAAKKDSEKKQILDAAMKDAINKAVQQQLNKGKKPGQPGEDPNPGVGPTFLNITLGTDTIWDGRNYNLYQNPNSTFITNPVYGGSGNGTKSATNTGMLNSTAWSNAANQYGVAIAFVTAHWRLNNTTGGEISNATWFNATTNPDGSIGVQNRTVNIEIKTISSLLTSSGALYSNSMVWAYGGGVPDERYPPPGYQPIIYVEILNAYGGVSHTGIATTTIITTQLKNLTAGNPDHPSDGIVIVGVGSAVGFESINVYTSANANMRSPAGVPDRGIKLLWT